MAKNQDLHLFVDVGAEPQDHELGETNDRLIRNEASTSADPAVQAALIVR
jgi:hypothetical protein